MITRVKLKNWKSHRETDLRVGDGTNVFVGDIGTGKSSVLDAITYSLFGTLPVVQTRRIKLEDLIMNRPRSMDRAEIEVGFLTSEGEEFVVKRVIERGKGTVLSELRKVSGELIESPSSTRVSETIRSLLKLDYDLFERAIYSEQNRLDYFLTLPRGRRMESIDELLGIDKLELARKNMGTLVNRVKDRTEEREKAMAQLAQDASLALLPAREQELEDMELSIQTIHKRLQLLQPELEAISSQLQQMRKTEQELVRLEKISGGLEATKNALKRQLEQIKEKLGAAVGIAPDELRRRTASLEESYGEANARMNELNSSLTIGSSRVRELETRAEIFRERLEELAAEVERKRRLKGELEKLSIKELTELVGRLQLELREAGNELAACRARVQDLQRMLGELAAAGSTCPVCESPLEEDKKQQLLEQRRSQLKSQFKRSAELEARVKGLDDDLRRNLELQKKALLLVKGIEDLPKLEVESSQLSRRLECLGKDLASARLEVEGIKKGVDGVRKEVDSLREQLASTKQILQLRLDLDQLELEHKRKSADCLRIQRELWQLRRGYDEAKVKELERRDEELIREHERLRTELAGMKQLIAEKKKFIDEIKEKREMISRYEVEIKHLRGTARALSMIQTALARTQTTLRREFIDGVNEAMGELWGNIYPHRDLTGIRLSVEGGERGGDYVLQVRDRTGNWMPVEGIASGGERTDACLVLRIAFAIVLAPALSWIVLDEPTHNLDAEGIRELAVVLRERIPEVVKQVLLITHEERLEAAVSGYLYRFSRDKDVDEPTKVEQVSMPESFG